MFCVILIEVNYEQKAIERFAFSNTTKKLRSN